MQTVGLISLGCPKNLVDSEIMLGLLEEAGYRIVQDPAEAEVLIVNTCSFIEDARKEAVDAILEMTSYKDEGRRTKDDRFARTKDNSSLVHRPSSFVGRGRCKKLVVAGCLTQMYKNKLARLLPEVDLFVGTGEYCRIVELLNTKRVSRCSMRVSAFDARDAYRDSTTDTRIAKRETMAVGIPQYIHTSTTPRKIATPRHAVYVKIAEGCFHGCSFCIIPKLRGKFRSRTMDDIAAEAGRLIAGGARELNLIAQDTTSYGRDLLLDSARKIYSRDIPSITNLIRRLEAIDGDFWIRVMYAYPTSITDEFVETMAASKKVCRYLDIPIQHINDRILTAMGRKERSRDIRRLIGRLRTRIPDITLRTSLIVGFPGETRAEFTELLDFVKEGHFDHLGVFTYSREKGTYAARLPGQTRRSTKETRRSKIMKAQAEVSKKRNDGKIGKVLKVLVEVIPSPLVGEGRGEGVGRTEGQAPDIDGVTYVGSGVTRHYSVGGQEGQGSARHYNVGGQGEFANVEIIGADEYDLRGVCLNQNTTT